MAVAELGAPALQKALRLEHRQKSCQSRLLAKLNCQSTLFLSRPPSSATATVVLRVAHFSQGYRTLLAFIGSLNYTDFGTISLTLVKELLQEAEIDFEQDAYILNVPPYTTPGIDLCFELTQETGHRNAVRLTFTEQEKLSEFQLHTSL